MAESSFTMALTISKSVLVSTLVSLSHTHTHTADVKPPKAAEVEEAHEHEQCVIKIDRETYQVHSHNTSCYVTHHTLLSFSMMVENNRMIDNNNNTRPG